MHFSGDCYLLILLAFLWACYAVKQQKKLYGWSWWRIILTFVLNVAFCPMAITLAILLDEVPVADRPKHE